MAEYADIPTMNILANNQPLKSSYDLRTESISANRAVLKRRLDYAESLAEAFDELIEVAIAELDDAKSIESILESELFVSARSSFHSELAGAISRLNSIQRSPTGFSTFEKEQWDHEMDLFYSPTSPTTKAGFSPPSCDAV